MDSKEDRVRPISPSVPRLAYSISEAAEALGSGRSKIYEEIGAGKLRAFKMGKLTRITHDELQRYADSLPRAVIAAPRPRSQAGA